MYERGCDLTGVGTKRTSVGIVCTGVIPVDLLRRLLVTNRDSVRLARGKRGGLPSASSVFCTRHGRDER